MQGRLGTLGLGDAGRMDKRTLRRRQPGDQVILLGRLSLSINITVFVSK